MQIKVKSLALVLSVILNVFFILAFLTASMSKTSHLSFYNPDDGHATAAALVSFPPDAVVTFDLIEINMKPNDKVTLQFSVLSPDKKQGNLLLNALYDPDIINVLNTGYGIIITAVNQGATLMQTLTNDGIKDVALVVVE